jgi:hypothetical protein
LRLGTKFSLILIWFLFTGVSFTDVYAEKAFLVIGDKLNFDSTGIGEYQSRNITVYGLRDNLTIEFLASDLNDESGNKTIEAENIRFNERKNLTINVDKGGSNETTVSILPNERGIYSGFIYLWQLNSNESTTIPITLDTGPLLGESLALILFGFGVSILAWTIQSYFSLTSRFKAIKETVKDLNVDIARYKQFVKNYKFYLLQINHRLVQLVGEMKESNIESADIRLQQSQSEFSGMIDRQNLEIEQLDTIATLNAAIRGQDESTFIFEFENDGNEIKRKGTKEPGAGPLSSILKDLEKTDFSLWNYLKQGRIKYSVTFTTVAIILGLFVGLSTLLQQANLNELREINWTSGLILFGLGIGIDSLKQIIERYIVK